MARFLSAIVSSEIGFNISLGIDSLTLSAGYDETALNVTEYSFTLELQQEMINLKTTISNGTTR